jgi:hypothetical protein
MRSGLAPGEAKQLLADDSSSWRKRLACAVATSIRSRTPLWQCTQGARMAASTANSTRVDNRGKACGEEKNMKSKIAAATCKRSAADRRNPADEDADEDDS